MPKNFIQAVSRLRQNTLSGFYWGGAGSLAFARWAYLTKFGTSPPAYWSDGTSDDLTAGLEYSKRALTSYRPNARAKRLLGMVSYCSTPECERLLIVGPRYENEVFLARAFGWKAGHVSAVDLLSYSAKIQVADIHALPFPKDAFDAISCGWTLSYSRDPQVAAGELHRVLRPGGIIGIGIEVVDPSFRATEIDGILAGAERVQSRSQILALFDGYHVLTEVLPDFVPGNAFWVLRRPM